VEYTVPDFISKVEQDDAPYRVSESPIPMDDVRLVHTVLDPDTHETKEVIVDTMILRKRLVPTDKEGAVARIPPRTTYPVVDESGWKVGEVTTEDKAKKWEGYQVQEYRVIPVYETEILEVKKPKEDAEKPFFDVDTLLITVEEETRVSFPLIAAPMPLSVIDELRSKYSRFRDRHDDEWIQGKFDTVRAKETMLQERRRMMRTPLQELRERQKQLKEEHLAQKELDDAALLKIGEAMASKFGSEQVLRRLQAAEEREERAKL
jgi:large subunit ribosomal protein L24